jgi:hypothetical protein
MSRFLVLALILSLSVDACTSAGEPRRPTRGADRPATPTSRPSFASLLDGSHWLDQYREAVATEPEDSPAGEAWTLGAWWAIIDWCGSDNKDCIVRAATFISTQTRIDPRQVDPCKWGAGGAIGGVVADGFEATARHLTGTPTSQRMLPELFDEHEAYGGDACD